MFCGKGGAELGGGRKGGGALTPSSCRPTLTPSTPCSSFPSAAWTLFSVSLLSRNLHSPLCQRHLWGWERMMHGFGAIHCRYSFATHIYLCRRRKM